MSVDLEAEQRSNVGAGTTAPVSGGKAEPPFFAVSPLKLLVMSVCTAGFYELYWYYRHWQRIKEREGTHILPFWRAIFAIFFCYRCFAKIREYGNAHGVPMRLPAGLLAAGWIVLTMMWRLPDPYWWLTSLSILFILPAQLQANRINAIECPGHERNARFSAWNWLVIVLGGSFMILALIGTFAPEPATGISASVVFEPKTGA